MYWARDIETTSRWYKIEEEEERTNEKLRYNENSYIADMRKTRFAVCDNI